MSDTDPHPTYPHALLAFLGTAKYDTAQYQRAGAEPTHATRYVQIACLNEILKGEGIRGNIEAIVFLTAEARAMHWQASGTLRDALDASGVPSRTVAIPSGKDEDEHWTIFQSIVEAVPHGQIVHVDITHGFRSLPALLIKALDYLRRVKNVTVANLDYGAFTPGLAVAPLVDLRPLLDIDAWATAYAAFNDSGDLLQLSSVVNRTLGTADRASLPKPLNALPAAFKNLGEALAHCRLPDVRPQALKALKALKAAEADVASVPRLAPLSPILAAVQHKLAPLSGDQSAREPELFARLAAAEYHFLRQNYIAGYAFLRELLVDILSAAATGAGVVAADRLEVDKWLGATSTPDNQALSVTPLAPHIDAPWLTTFRRAAGPIMARRNVFLHAHTNLAKAPKSSGSYAGDAKSHLASVRTLLDDTFPLTLTPPAPPATRATP
jgi:CRISPR-associated Csx2 family protein